MFPVRDQQRVPEAPGRAGHQREGQELFGVPGGCGEHCHEEPQGEDHSV